MRITRLELENWMGIPQLELDFSTGINLLYGRNEIGKSSIIESIRYAILGDASLKKTEYKSLPPWGTDVKAHVKLSFTAKGEEYQLDKSFPGGFTALYHRGVKVADEAKKAREKLFAILDISETTTNLLRLLFINQGESLNIFEKKGSPLDDPTKSYIKDVIKETTFRELQTFQDEINKILSSYLSTERKNIKKGSPYYELTEKEKELAITLEELQQKETQLQEKITEIDKADLDILRLHNEANEKEKYLSVLKKKKERLDDLEKKELTFAPIKKDYDHYIQMKFELDEIHRGLPILLSTRQTRIDEQKKKLGDLEKEKKQAQESFEKLKIKKQEGEKIQLYTHQFEKIAADYNDLKNMEDHVQEIRKSLPQIIADTLYLQDTQLKKLSETLQFRSQTEEELSRLESQIQNLPKVTQKELKELQKLEDEISKLNDKIATFREELKLNFCLTPLNERRIPYTIQTGDNQINTGTTLEPLVISGFQKLRFNYPEHLDIHVTGNLAKTDFETLQSDLLSKKEQLAQRLAAFNVATVSELEKKHEEITQLKIQRDHIKTKLDSTEKRLTLEKQKKEIGEAIQSLKQDSRKYIGDNPHPLSTIPQEEKNPPSLHVLNQQLSTAKANLDTFQSRKNVILEKYQSTLLELEENYKQQKNQLQMHIENYHGLEPQAKQTVTDNDLEKAVFATNTIDKRMVANQNEIKLLEEMDPLPVEAINPAEHPQHTTFTSQQLRDKITQSLNRRLDLEQKKQELLRENTEEEFKRNYFHVSEELKNLQEEIKNIPPLQFTESKVIEKEIRETEQSIKHGITESVDRKNRRERLLGETADFSQTIEEKNDRELEYRHTLAAIKTNIAEISALQLLNKLIDEVKEEAQQEVFKPLQERVVNTFSTLVGDRYQIGIDNNLNLEIAGRTFTGDYQTGIDQSLSFGTKEQLSFLFRLAIATELSRKEPGVMVLDDSFVNTDRHRFPLLMDMLMEQATKLQFLVFTCRPADYLSYFPAWENLNINCVDLEKRIKALIL